MTTIETLSIAMTTIEPSNFSSDITEETEPEKDVLNITLSVVIGLVGVVGNAGVLIVFGSSQRLRRKPVNICLMNQSAIDLAASFLLTVNGTQDPNNKISFTGKSVGTQHFRQKSLMILYNYHPIHNCGYSRDQ